MAAELLEWVAQVLKQLDKSLWVGADGAYARAPFPEPPAQL